MRINNYLIKEELAMQAYGTSKGAFYGWDSRGRGTSPQLEQEHKNIQEEGFRHTGVVKKGEMQNHNHYTGHGQELFVHPAGTWQSWKSGMSGKPQKVNEGSDFASLHEHMAKK